jgi:hydroxymethylpyrimidine/phosphomethylpyrimidine kinase
MARSLPVALSIAGSDCSSGAGLQADLKTFQSFGVHGLTAVTCVVSETANIVRAVHPVPVGVVEDQISLLLDAFPIAAVKTGMLFSAAHVRAVAAALRGSSCKLVVDPVMIASTGDPLLEPDAVVAYETALLPLATVITPNLPEAEALLGRNIPSLDDVEAAALELSAKYGTSVLLKGGHLPGNDCVDLLCETSGTIHRFHSPRLDVAASHGTGCTLSAALCAALALGHPLAEAVGIAKEFLNAALAGSLTFSGPDGGTVHALDQSSRPRIRAVSKS